VPTVWLTTRREARRSPTRHQRAKGNVVREPLPPRQSASEEGERIRGPTRCSEKNPPQPAGPPQERRRKSGRRQGSDREQARERLPRSDSPRRRCRRAAHPAARNRHLQAAGAGDRGALGASAIRSRSASSTPAGSRASDCVSTSAAARRWRAGRGGDAKKRPCEAPREASMRCPEDDEHLVAIGSAAQRVGVSARPPRGRPGEDIPAETASVAATTVPAQRRAHHGGESSADTAPTRESAPELQRSSSGLRGTAHRSRVRSQRPRQATKRVHHAPFRYPGEAKVAMRNGGEQDREETRKQCAAGLAEAEGGRRRLASTPPAHADGRAQWNGERTGTMVASRAPTAPAQHGRETMKPSTRTAIPARARAAAPKSAAMSRPAKAAMAPRRMDRPPAPGVTDDRTLARRARRSRRCQLRPVPSTSSSALRGASQPRRRAVCCQSPSRPSQDGTTVGQRVDRAGAGHDGAGERRFAHRVFARRSPDRVSATGARTRRTSPCS